MVILKCFCSVIYSAGIISAAFLTPSTYITIKTFNMEKTTDYKPKGFNSITPYLIVENADKFIEFVKTAFKAEEKGMYKDPNTGRIMHSVVKIGDSFIEISDSTAEYPATQAALHLYVPDVDAVYKQAVEAGGTGKMEPRDQFYGDRESFVEDPFGNHWYISTHKKDVSEEEMKKMHEAANN
jgi:PhnB protein